MTTTSNRTQWEALPQCLDPLTPAGAPDAPQLVRVERPYSPLPELVRDLTRPPSFGMQRALVHGPPGSGKSTELLAAAGLLVNQHLVLQLDLLDHFQEQRGDAAALGHLHPWEVLAVIGLALHRFGDEVLGHRWEPHQVQALAAAVAEAGAAEKGSIDVARLGKEVALVVAAGADASGGGGAATLALRGLAAVAGSASRKLPLGLRGRDELPDQDGRVQALRNAVQSQLSSLFVAFGRRVLLVVDGIDRGGSALSARLFERSQLLAELTCHQLMCVSPGTRIRNVRGYRTMPICNLPVVDQDRAPEPGQGVAFFRELWAARAKAAGVPAALVTTAQVDALAWASGGMSRIFLTMLQDAIGLAWDDDAPALLDGHIVKVVDDWRRRWEEGLTSGKRAALQAVSDTREIDDSELHAALLDELCIVAFPNESIWYYPHPLLTPRARQFRVESDASG